MADFKIKGIAYQSKLMDGATQTLVLKRLLPTFMALVGAATPKVAEDAPVDEDEGATLAPVHEMLLPAARELAALRDDDVSFIINSCLAVTKRQVATGVGWVDVVQRGIVQDQSDAKFITRLTIAWHVLAENFGEMLASFGLDVDTLAKAAPRLAPIA